MRRKLFGVILAVCIGWFQAEALTGKAYHFSVDHVTLTLTFTVMLVHELVFYRLSVDANTT